MDEQRLRKIFDSLFSPKEQIETQIMQRVWFRNLLYYLGEQWFEWVRGQNTFRRLMPSPYTPTPVANIIRDYVRSMKSLILNKDYTVSIWPNSNDLDDREAATMGEQFLRWMETLDDERALDEKEKVAIWMLICGTSFDRTYPDMDGDKWVFDASGNPIKKGNVVTESVNSFSVCVDKFGDRFRQKRWVGIKSLRPKEWVEDTFKIKVAAGGDESLIDYERQLAKLVSNVSPWKGDGIEFGRGPGFYEEDMVIFKEVEIRPTRKEPKGMYVAMVGDQFVFKYNRLPIPAGKEGEWEYSITDYHYHFTPGRFWSDSGINDLISPQNTINEIDQDLSINRKGIGKPMVIMPSEVTMKKLTQFGQSIIVLQYDALTSGGAKPEIGRGIALPGQVLDERMVHLQNAQDAAGDPKNVLRGKAPSTQSSGVMVDILRDAAEQGHLPDVERFYRSYKRTKRKQLILAQEVFTEERLVKIPDKGGRPKVKKFKGADLRSNTDVRMELASGAASTRAGQTNMVIKLLEQGFFAADNMMDPEFKQEILRRVGLSGFKDKTSPDADRAISENERVAIMEEKDLVKVRLRDNQTNEELEILCVPGLYAAMGGGGPEEPGIVLMNDPMFRYDDHAVHYEQHRRFFMGTEFKNLHPALQDALMVHADYHKWTLEAEAQAQAQAQMEALATQEAMKKAKMIEAGMESPEGEGVEPEAPGAVPPPAPPGPAVPASDGMVPPGAGA